MADEDMAEAEAAQDEPAVAEPVVVVAEAAAPAVPAPSPEAASLHQAIDAWIDSHIRNSPIAQSTPAWNHLMSVIPALKAKIQQEL